MPSKECDQCDGGARSALMTMHYASDKQPNGLLYAPPHTLHSVLVGLGLLVSYCASRYVFCQAPELLYE